MVSNYKVPPKFDETRPYESWKNEVNVWRRVPELKKNKQALVLEGRARETAMEIPAEDLSSENDMTALLTKLDSVFLKEEKLWHYERQFRVHVGLHY